MPDELDDAILENATGPKQVSGDEGTVVQHSLQDQIAAAKHLAGTASADKPARGMRFTQLIPPGATS